MRISYWSSGVCSSDLPDLAPFAALRDAAMAMTCHVIFEAWDADRPATLSPVVIDNVIRQRIGFHGLLMTDDLDMKALSGDVPSRAADARSEEHTSELQSLMRSSYAVFCLKQKK